MISDRNKMIFEECIMNELSLYKYPCIFLNLKENIKSGYSLKEFTNHYERKNKRFKQQ